jgi:hypothetical protein
MRKLSTLAIIFFAIATLAYAANTRIKIKASEWAEVGFRSRSLDSRARLLSARVEQGNLMAADIVRRVGGVVFLEVASPAPELRGVCPKLSYDHAKPMGMRFTANFGATRAAARIADWEIKPILKFVESNDHGLVSLNKPYNSDGFVGQLIEVQASVDNMLAGYVLLLADSIRRVDLAAAIQLLDKQPILGFNREFDGRPIDVNEDKVLEAQEDVIEAMGGNQLMFTDWKENFVFNVRDGELTISGAPYYLPLSKDTSENGIPLWAQAKNTKEDKQRLLADIRPVYEPAYRFARYSAFFRYLKQECKDQWTEFSSSIRGNDSIDTIEIEIPVAVRPF